MPTSTDILTPAGIDPSVPARHLPDAAQYSPDEPHGPRQCVGSAAPTHPLPQHPGHPPPTLIPTRQHVGYGLPCPAGAPLVPPTRQHPLQDSTPLSLAPPHSPHSRPPLFPPTSLHHHLPARFAASGLTPASATPPNHASTTTCLRSPAPQKSNPPSSNARWPPPQLHALFAHPALLQYPHSRRN